MAIIEENCDLWLGLPESDNSMDICKHEVYILLPIAIKTNI